MQLDGGIAIARAWVTGTAGEITVNDQPLERPSPCAAADHSTPLEMAGVSKFSIKATVHGGGPTGQAGALRHTSRALVSEPAAPRPAKKEGLLTRDSRSRAQKYGQGARKRFNTPNDKTPGPHDKRGKRSSFYVYSYNHTAMRKNSHCHCGSQRLCRSGARPLIALHPHFELIAVTSEKSVGASVGSVFQAWLGPLTFKLWLPRLLHNKPTRSFSPSPHESLDPVAACMATGKFVWI
jgi:small subunit ribosomal protein S9